MFRRTPLFLLALVVVVGSLAAAQEPAATPNQGQAASPQPQTQQSQPQQSQKPDSSANPSSESHSSDPGVLILKSPKAPITPETAPELRAVDLEKRPKLNDGTRLQLIQLMQAEFAHVRKYFPLGDKSLVINPQG